MSKLYIVPTPIGNLEDISFRAVNILKEVDFILAEDTRTTSILLKHYDISKPVFSYHKFNEHQVIERFIQKIKEVENVALVSDAGTPGISDPGFLIVREAIKNDIDLECLPGAVAFIPALILSGLPNDRFCFEGFLPQKKGRQKRLYELKQEKRTMIFYESPFRVAKTIGEFAEFFGNERKASISREISKLYEETIRGTLAELKILMQTRTLKGEIVICVEGDNDK
jgi:16S rRNA (cytidine1402-2'-O)-methyltransferase